MFRWRKYDPKPWSNLPNSWNCCHWPFSISAATENPWVLIETPAAPPPSYPKLPTGNVPDSHSWASTPLQVAFWTAPRVTPCCPLSLHSMVFMESSGSSLHHNCLWKCRPCPTGLPGHSNILWALLLQRWHKHNGTRVPDHRKWRGPQEGPLVRCEVKRAASLFKEFASQMFLPQCPDCFLCSWSGSEDQNLSEYPDITFESHVCFPEIHCIFAKINILKHILIFTDILVHVCNVSLVRVSEWFYWVTHFNSTLW